MKRSILTLSIIFCLFFAAKAQESTTTTPPENPNAAEISFKSETVDYGTIPHKAEPYREFIFTNTGKEPLIISNCKGSCGCTVPKCPTEPIAPGATGKIKVRYDTNRIGPFSKSVTVVSNAKTSPKVVRIKGVVEAPPPAPESTTPGTATPSNVH